MGFSRIVRVARSGSTNDDLREAALAEPEAWPHGSVLVAEHQVAGKGRAGRGWETPPGVALTASVLLRPGLPAERLAWAPLLTGLAVQRACARVAARSETVRSAETARSGETVRSAEGVRSGSRSRGGSPVSSPNIASHGTGVSEDGTARAPAFGLKWPNDVLALDAAEEELPGYGRDRKLVGILAEVLPAGPARSTSAAPARPAAPALVVGFGVNVAQRASQLPATATSLHLLGPRVTPAEVLDAVGAELMPLVDRWRAAGGDAVAAGLREEVAAACVTLGTPVRVELPAGAEVSGRAVALDAEGRLLVEGAEGTTPLSAGDVHHVRRAMPPP